MVTVVKKFFGIISKPRQKQGGYILPVILALGIALTGLGTFTLGVTSNISSDANNQIYKQLATEASRSGLAVAQSCLSKNGDALWSGDLLPNEDCQGSVEAGRSQYVLNDTTKNISSSYTVTFSPVVDGKSTLTSVGTISRNGKVKSTDSLRIVVSGRIITPIYGSISPNSGTTGTIATITGSNFVSGSTSVTVGGVAASTTFVSTTQLRVTIPYIGVTSGYKDVVITTDVGSITATNAFYYYAAPTYGSISPTIGQTGTVATITGTNFVAGNTTVTVGGVAASISVNSTNSLTAVIPSISTSGAKDVVITTPGGSATGSNAFYYYAAPTYSSISPASGTNGTVTTITGSNFVSGGTSVTVGGVSASTSVNSTTSLTVYIPNIGFSGAKDVVISTPGGSATGYGVFYYYAAPTYSSISPASGTMGTVTTITGSNFVSGNTTVTVGGVAATTTFVSTTSLTVTIPSIGSTGYKNVVITTPGGSATGTGVFYYYLAPTFTSITPNRITQDPGYTGTTVTITGANFVSGNTTVTYGGISATNVNVTSTTSLTATVQVPYTGWFGPADNGAKDVTITANGVSVTAPGALTFAIPTETRLPSGACSYTVPSWAQKLDIIILGGGGGGAAGTSVDGKGGAAGSWSATTLTKGINLPSSTTTLNCTIGAGGAGAAVGGSPSSGGSSSVSGSGVTTLSAAGGIGGGSTGKTGAAPNPNYYNYNGRYYRAYDATCIAPVPYLGGPPCTNTPDGYQWYYGSGGNGGNGALFAINRTAGGNGYGGVGYIYAY